MSGYDPRLYQLAVDKGWKLPATNNPFPADAWNRYWAEKEDYERKLEAGDPDPGRPVVPHRSA